MSLATELTKPFFFLISFKFTIKADHIVLV